MIKVKQIVTLMLLVASFVVSIACFGGEMAYANDSEGNEKTYRKVTEKRVTIKRKVIVKKSSALPKGYSRVIKKGHDGVAVKTITRTYLTESDDLIATNKDVQIVKKKKNKVVLKGTRSVVSKVNRGTSRLDNIEKTIKMEATAYTHTGCKTASGRVAKVGHVAVDPRVIPLGSLLYVKYIHGNGRTDYGYCIAADTGGAIKGKRIDLFFNSTRECNCFGRKKVIVYVLR